MIRKYIISVSDETEGWEKSVEDLNTKWGVEEITDPASLNTSGGLTNGDIVHRLLSIDSDNCVNILGEQGEVTLTVTQSWWDSICRDLPSVISWWNASYSGLLSVGSCEDCISREDVIDALCQCVENPSSFKAALEEIKQLPPVKPARQKGYFINKGLMWECSECGAGTRIMKKYNIPNFCPCCGAELEVR